MNPADVRYAVEWCSSLPVVDGEHDFDRAVYEVRYFARRSDAVRYAKAKLPFDAVGEVRIEEEVPDPLWPDPHLRRPTGRYGWEESGKRWRVTSDGIAEDHS